jgi:hypothetical protein
MVWYKTTSADKRISSTINLFKQSDYGCLKIRNTAYRYNNINTITMYHTYRKSPAKSNNTYFLQGCILH